MAATGKEWILTTRVPTFTMVHRSQFLAAVLIRTMALLFLNYDNMVTNVATQEGG